MTKDKCADNSAKSNELVFVGSVGDLLDSLGESADISKVFAVTDSTVARLYPQILPENTFVIKAGEDSKTFAVAEDICRAMLNAGLNRGSVAVGIGGGVVGDITGFAASVYMRGIDFVNIPTTLLSQVDSAIGGKTGVNLDGYKNMIGSFKMPRRIIVCPEFLKTLPEREWTCGMGELIKTALLDGEIYEYVSKNLQKLNSRDAVATQKAVTMAADFKKKITDSDPSERGLRMILNLGHTVGHAIEKSDNHKLSHGEYVMLGMKIELAMTEKYNNGNPPFVCDVCAMIDSASCPALPEISAAEICRAAKADKKNTDGGITVIGLKRAGEPYVKKYSESEFYESYVSAVSALIERGELRCVKGDRL